MGPRASQWGCGMSPSPDWNALHVLYFTEACLCLMEGYLGVLQRPTAVGSMMPLLLAQQAPPLASAGLGDPVLPAMWLLLGDTLLSIGSAETVQNIQS